MIAREEANAATLMALNNSDKNLATFLSATGRVGLDEDQTWVDHNDPQVEEPSEKLSGCCKVPPAKTSTWSSRERSKAGALSLTTLGLYAAAFHVDFLHSKDINSYPAPQDELMIRQKL